MPEILPQRGVLRVVSPAQLTAATQQQEAEAAARKDAGNEQIANSLTGFIRGQFDIMRRHRDTSNAGWSERLLHALRVFNGIYDTQKLAEIQKFGGSTVYARLVSMKCRGASSLLRDVYLGPDRPWGLQPDDDPAVPDDVQGAIKTLIQSEVQTLTQQGQPPDPATMRDRVQSLMIGARDAAKKIAKQKAKISEEKLNEILVNGGFYDALAEFITDLPLFPYACIKGPEVRIVPTVTWENGRAISQNKPRLFWKRVSPFDIYWTPGVSRIPDAAFIERTRLTRADLNDLLDLPGYNVEAIRSVLDDYGRGGLNDNWDTTDSERANNENRENPWLNNSGLISCLEYHGNVQGRTLIEGGFPEDQIDDPLRDFFVQAWIIGNYCIKVQMSPSPRKRHPYFVTSFEKVPGTPVGNGLPDILADIQEVANASLRSLVNNLSIASGPQVVVHTDRIAPDADAEEMYPWKRWLVTSDPMGGSNTVPPISFFQPSSNAGENLQVYQKFSDLADELSAIPKYLSGNYSGGAGRTASGLAMLMGNASKILQTVAANIDNDVISPALDGLYDMVMLTDTSGLLTGQESVRVMGVQVAVQKETQRARQLELLQITGNPIDMSIIGPEGRAALLRAVSTGVGLDGEEIVPSDEQVKAKVAEAEQQAQQAMAMQAGGGPPGAGGAPPQGGGGAQMPFGMKKRLHAAANPQPQQDMNSGMSSGGYVGMTNSPYTRTV